MRIRAQRDIININNVSNVKSVMLNIIVDSTINLTCKSDDLQGIQQYQYTVLTNQPQNYQSCIILGLKAKPINP